MAFNLTLRKSFLYIFATVGLVLTIISAVSFLNLGLRSYVFTKSDYPCHYARGPYPELKNPDGTNLTPAQQEERAKEEERICMEQRTSDKQRQASNALAELLVGVPLFWYTWSTIRKENQV